MDLYLGCKIVVNFSNCLYTTRLFTSVLIYQAKFTLLTYKCFSFQEAVAARSNIVHELETPTVSRPEVCWNIQMQK